MKRIKPRDLIRRRFDRSCLINLFRSDPRSSAVKSAYEVRVPFFASASPPGQSQADRQRLAEHPAALLAFEFHHLRDHPRPRRRHVLAAERGQDALAVTL